MRPILICSLSVIAPLLASNVQAADEVDAAKLVGRWVPAQIPERLAGDFARTFAKDGKYAFGSKLNLKGTYKVEGTKLTVKFDDVPGVPGETQVYTIKKLTDTELTLVAGNQAETFKRAK